MKIINYKTLLSLLMLSLIALGCVPKLKSNTSTTLYFIRHAEKVNGSSPDPKLSEAGEKRALTLVNFVKNKNISAIYSTPYRRTQQTVTPLSQILNLTVQTYNPMNPEEIKRMVSLHRGKTILIVGHSNTIPMMINQLSHNEVMKAIPEQEYHNFYILTYQPPKVHLEIEKY